MGIYHIFANNQRVASIRSDGKNQFYHPNHLGSASVITDQHGGKKEQIEYYPFGLYRAVGHINGTYDFDPTFPDVFYTFTGQEIDDEVEFYNFKARLYDPVLGRFISPDRLVQAPENPQTLNRHTYCLNNPLIYTDPSGEFIEWLIIGFIFGAFMGAAQADMSGKNVLVGALVGGLIGAVSAGVGGWVGGTVTQYLTTTVWIAESATATAAANVVGTMVGGFAGGAVSGGLNAAVYGGNVWQSALYGGLIGAAIAGLIQGAVELNNWGNSNATITLKDPKTGQLRSMHPGQLANINEAISVEKVKDILGATDELKKAADLFYQYNKRIQMVPIEEDAGAKFQAIRDVCTPTWSGCGPSFDLRVGSQNAIKFNTDKLHVRYFPEEQLIRFHWDRFNIHGDFFRHVWVDVIKNWWYGGGL